MSSINYLTRIEFGEGEIRRLPEFLGQLGSRRPLIATDRGLRASGLVERVTDLLGASAVVFDGTPSNPTETSRGSSAASLSKTAFTAFWRSPRSRI